MSIIVVRGPEAPHANERARAHALRGEIVASLLDSAVLAGRALAVRACGSDQELLDALAQIEREPPEFILLDPGASLRNPGVCQALRNIKVPYIEIHDDACAALEPELQDASPARVAVVHGYMAQSYTLAMAQALEHLGCAECHSDYHVGT